MFSYIGAWFIYGLKCPEKVKYFRSPRRVFGSVRQIISMSSVTEKMVPSLLLKIFSVAILFVGVSAKWKCPDMLSLTANLTRNGTFETEVGFNRTFPLIKTVDGNVTQVAPWINLTRMSLELNFTAEQRTPLTLLINQTNLTSVSVTYQCNITYFNCTVSCSFAEQTVERVNEESNLLGTEGSSLCTEGYHLSDLRNQSDRLELKWTKMCDYLVTMQIKDQALAYMRYTDNETIQCDFNTTVPLRYNITLHGTNLTDVEQICTQNENQTVMCLVTNSTQYIHNGSLPQCTVRSPPWPVMINAKFNYSEEELTQYQYDDPNYYDYLDDYYRENSKEENEGEEEEEDEDEEEEEEVEEEVEGTTLGPSYEKHVKDPRSDDKRAPPSETVLLVVGIVALAAVAMLAFMVRKRKTRARNVHVHYNQSRSPY